jgi:hypothetical protein
MLGRRPSAPRRLRRAGLAAVLGLASACTMKNAAVPPEQLMSELQAGQPVLDCRADCGLAWANNRQQAAALDATAQWRQLALLVMQIGYMDDLTYYYLGRAAENLGYLQPAQRYYRIAEQISVTNMSCHQGEVDAQDALGIPVSECNGYVFPDALYPHLEVVESRLASLSNSPPPPPTPHKRRVARKPSHPPVTAATASGGQAPGQAAGVGFVVPTPTAGAADAASGFVAPAPTAASGLASSSDQFAIPPVRR